MTTPKCYDCKYRGTVPGSAHSSCNYPYAKSNPHSTKGGLGIVGTEYGIENGWFYWPYNFDPVWLERCDGFGEAEK